MISEPEDGVKFTFDAAFQQKIAAHALRDTQFMRQANGLLRKEYFEDIGLQFLVNYAADYFARFEQTPSLPILLNDVKELKDAGRLKSETLSALAPQLKEIYAAGYDLSNRDYMVDAVAKFARKVAMENAILKAAEMLDKGGEAYDEAFKLVDEARQVGSIDEGIHFEFYSTIEERVDRRISMMASGVKLGITTGVAELDKSLYHGGWGRGELSVLMGPPKAGKSIGLGEFAINATIDGKNVLYCSLENGAAIVGDRMDANVSGVSMRDIMGSPAVKAAVAKAALTRGKLFVHEFPTGTMRPMDVRRLLKRYAAKGVIIDLVVIDYADIMAPDRPTGAENTDSKEIYKGIRAIAQQENVAMLTATQTNRDGAKATVAKVTDVSEDINRVRLADVFLILAASDQEKADDVFRLYLAAMRNSESGIMFTCKSDRKRMKFIKSISASSL